MYRLGVVVWVLAALSRSGLKIVFGVTNLRRRMSLWRVAVR
nr:MAG TPA: hypothetical protein [Caudoviricetes sp.]